MITGGTPMTQETSMIYHGNPWDQCGELAKKSVGMRISWDNRRSAQQRGHVALTSLVQRCSCRSVLDIGSFPSRDFSSWFGFCSSDGGCCTSSFSGVRSSADQSGSRGKCCDDQSPAQSLRHDWHRCDCIQFCVSVDDFAQCGFAASTGAAGGFLGRLGWTSDRCQKGPFCGRLRQAGVRIHDHSRPAKWSSVPIWRLQWPWKSSVNTSRDSAAPSNRAHRDHRKPHVIPGNWSSNGGETPNLC